MSTVYHDDAARGIVAELLCHRETRRNPSSFDHRAESHQFIENQFTPWSRFIVWLSRGITDTTTAHSLAHAQADDPPPPCPASFASKRGGKGAGTKK